MCRWSLVLFVLFSSLSVHAEIPTKENTILAIEYWQQYASLPKAKKIAFGIQNQFFPLVEEMSKRTGVSIYDGAQGFDSKKTVADLSDKIVEHLKNNPQIEFVFGLPRRDLIDYLDDAGEVLAKSPLYRKIEIKIDKRTVLVELRAQEGRNVACVINTWEKIDPKIDRGEMFNVMGETIQNLNKEKTEIPKEKLLFIGSVDPNQRTFLVFSKAMENGLVLMKCTLPAKSSTKEVARSIAKGMISADDFVRLLRCQGKIMMEAEVDENKEMILAGDKAKAKKYSDRGWTGSGVALVPALLGGGFATYAYSTGKCKGYRNKVILGAGLVTVISAGYGANQFSKADEKNREILNVISEIDLAKIPDEIEQKAEHIGENVFHREVDAKIFQDLELAYW